MDRIKNIESTRKTPVLSLDQFLNEDNGFQIKMEDFDAELASSYKEISGNDMKSTIDSASASGSSEGGGGESVNKSYIDAFTKKARTTLPSRLSGLETDRFLDINGKLKNKYSGGFIKAWESAIDANKDGSFGYFFYDGGLYETDSVNSSLNTPCNWPKWSESNKDTSSDHIKAFILNYESSYPTSFAKLPKTNPVDCIDRLVKSGSISGMSYEKTMNRLKESVTEYPDCTFIPYDRIRIIRDDLNTILSNDDWGMDQFVVFNNILVILSNTVTFYDGKIKSGFRWIYENSNILVEARRIADDKIMSDGDNYTPNALVIKPSDTGSFVVQNITRSGINDFGSVNLDSKTNDAFSKITPLTTSKAPEIKAILARNLYYIVNGVYNVLQGHVRRMNSKEFSNVPQTPGNKTFDASKK
jgi:hypothetical protein